nr:hypothetical protein Q903MT_gene5188 [Picea sitchensis]
MKLGLELLVMLDQLQPAIELPPLLLPLLRLLL